MRTSPLPLALAVCGALASSCGGGGGGGGPTVVPAVDPMALALDVSPTALGASIDGLEQLGTRYTIGSGDEQARDHLLDRIAAMGLSAELDPFSAGGETANNVIVRHVGTVDPNVVYLFCAHYDSTSDTPDTWAPGADDNASGVAALLEGVRLITQHAFRYSVWFVFSAAEEQGSLGSAHLASWLAGQGFDVRGAVVPDMIAYWPQADQSVFDILGDPGSVALVDRMADVATRLGVAHQTWIQHTYCYGDDQTRFQDAGIPAVAVMDCVDAHNVPSAGETVPNYHRGTDTTGTLYMPMFAEVTGVMIATLAELAEPVATTKP